MKRISTGDVVRAFRIIWPKITEDMVRAASEDGTLKAERPNPFSRQGAYDYCPESIQTFLEKKGVPSDQKQAVLTALGINSRTMKLVRTIPA